MRKTSLRLGIICATVITPLAYATVISPGVSSAIECGYGTFFDPPSNTCVAAPAPPPPAPPPPAWNGDITPYFSIGVCAPIPFVAICTGI
jgi:hypothetical protein